MHEDKNGSVFQHIVNCCHVDKTCASCKDKDADEPCEQCSVRHLTFTGPTTIDDFCNWLFSDINKNCYALAHNSRG